MKSYAERTIFHGTAQAIWSDAVDLVRRVSPHYGNEVHLRKSAGDVDIQDGATRSDLVAPVVDEPAVFDRPQLSVSKRERGVGRVQLALVQVVKRLQRGTRQLVAPQLIDVHFSVSRGYDASTELRTDIRQDMVERLVREMQTPRS